jgi:hypothetical protein
MNIFQSGKGVNCDKLNANFAELQNASNQNESDLNAIASDSLKKDGSNLTQDIVNRFNQITPNIIESQDDVSLTDNSVNFLTLTGNATIILPSIGVDNFSHTIQLVVAGSSYSLALGTTKHILNLINIDITETYSVLYIYNKLDNSWYYSLTQ